MQFNDSKQPTTPSPWVFEIGPGQNYTPQPDQQKEAQQLQEKEARKIKLLMMGLPIYWDTLDHKDKIKTLAKKIIADQEEAIPERSMADKASENMRGFFLVGSALFLLALAHIAFPIAIAMFFSVMWNTVDGFGSFHEAWQILKNLVNVKGDRRSKRLWALGILIVSSLLLVAATFTGLGLAVAGVICLHAFIDFLAISFAVAMLPSLLQNIAKHRQQQKKLSRIGRLKERLKKITETYITLADIKTALQNPTCSDAQKIKLLKQFQNAAEGVARYEAQAIALYKALYNTDPKNIELSVLIESIQSPPFKEKFGAARQQELTPEEKLYLTYSDNKAKQKADAELWYKNKDTWSWIFATFSRVAIAIGAGLAGATLPAAATIFFAIAGGTCIIAGLIKIYQALEQRNDLPPTQWWKPTNWETGVVSSMMIIVGIIGKIAAITTGISGMAVLTPLLFPGFVLLATVLLAHMAKLWWDRHPTKEIKELGRLRNDAINTKKTSAISAEYDDAIHNGAQEISDNRSNDLSEPLLSINSSANEKKLEDKLVESSYLQFEAAANFMKETVGSKVHNPEYQATIRAELAEAYRQELANIRKPLDELQYGVQTLKNKLVDEIIFEVEAAKKLHPAIPENRNLTKLDKNKVVLSRDELSDYDVVELEEKLAEPVEPIQAPTNYSLFSAKDKRRIAAVGGETLLKPSAAAA